METKNDHTSRAPGANDNASGVSATLEIASILYNINLKYDVQFVLFSGEEQSFLGSEQYAKLIRNNKTKLYRLINLDMIGYPKLNPGEIIIEKDDNTDYDKYNRVLCNDKDSVECGNIMEKMSAYTDLNPKKGSIYDSDYEPFEKRGYVVVGAYDGSADPSKNPHYHSTTDTPDKIDWNYLTSVTKIVLATIISLNKEND
jgi:Zn-dependent M28 family amino/carboxypeptidase